MTSRYLRDGEYVNMPVRQPDGSISAKRVLRSDIPAWRSRLCHVPADLAARMANKLEAFQGSAALPPAEIATPDLWGPHHEHVVDTILAAVVRHMDVPPAEVLQRQGPVAGLARMIACYLLTVAGGVPPREAEAILKMAPGAAHSARRRFARILARSGFSFSAGIDAAVAALFHAETSDEDDFADIPRVTFHECLAATISATGMSRSDLFSDRRPFELVRARHIGFWLCHTLTPLSLNDIARRFGGRDHTTVLHGSRRVARIAARLALPDDAMPEQWAALLWQTDWRALQ